MITAGADDPAHAGAPTSSPNEAPTPWTEHAVPAQGMADAPTILAPDASAARQGPSATTRAERPPAATDPTRHHHHRRPVSHRRPLQRPTTTPLPQKGTNHPQPGPRVKARAVGQQARPRTLRPRPGQRQSGHTTCRCQRTTRSPTPLPSVEEAKMSPPLHPTMAGGTTRKTART